jgi:hypothetical protein
MQCTYRNSSIRALLEVFALLLAATRPGLVVDKDLAPFITVQHLFGFSHGHRPELHLPEECKLLLVELVSPLRELFLALSMQSGVEGHGVIQNREREERADRGAQSNSIQKR